MKMVVDSDQPHFVGVDPDILSTGLVFYYLRVCSVVQCSLLSGVPLLYLVQFPSSFPVFVQHWGLQLLCMYWHYTDELVIHNIFPSGI